MIATSTHVQTGIGPTIRPEPDRTARSAPNALTSKSIAPRTREPARRPVTVMPGPFATTKGMSRTPDVANRVHGLNAQHVLAVG